MVPALKALKRCVPYSAKVWLREKALNHYGVPCSRFGLPGPLVTLFRGSPPITLVDVGASKGDFTDMVCQFCDIKKALLVELQPKRCEELRARFAQNRFQVVCAAAGSREEEREVAVLAWDYSTSLLKIDQTDANVVGLNDFSVREWTKTLVRPLDQLCHECGLVEPIDLLKLDVQGAEGMALEGARETLPRVRALWTEVSFRPLYERSITFWGVYELCRRAGFHLVALEDGYRGANGELLQADALFVRNGTAG
ncbi:MAG TPA: FkbM family methyltransferase [Candidatus Acidoferrum sp.]|jgi:FkbM family methyltransferase|nr:FkbM family methyltransferase [Candidatus Acidoferrum sp.]